LSSIRSLRRRTLEGKTEEEGEKKEMKKEMKKER
jgi:hypothetical protein